MAHTQDALSRSLKNGELAPAYYLHGPEDVLKDEAVRAILDRSLDPAMRDFNFDQRSASQMSPDEVYSLCNTLPMLAEHRVVLIREVEAWKRKTRSRTEFLGYLKNPSPQTIVVLIQGSAEESEDKELAQLTYSVRLEPLSGSKATKWVLRHATSLGLHLDPTAAEHLVEALGTDLGTLSAELAKLASLPDNVPITLEQVGTLVGIRRGETLLDWRTAVIEDKSALAVSLLPSILAQPGMSGVKMITALGTSLLGLAVTRKFYDRGLRGGGLEAAVFKILIRIRPGGLFGYKEEAARWARLVGQWPTSRLGDALRAAVEADQALKNTSLSDECGVLTDLVLRLGVHAMEAA